MHKIARRTWYLLVLAILAGGLVLAVSGYYGGDTGWGPLWYFAVVAMGFPLGTIFLLIGALLLGLVEITFLGTDTYFNPVAQVCFAWSAAVLGGVVQGALFRKWVTLRALRKAKANAP